MSCEYSSDDCWEGEVTRNPPKQKYPTGAAHAQALAAAEARGGQPVPNRSSFDGKPLPGRRSSAGKMEERPIKERFFDSEPAGNEKCKFHKQCCQCVCSTGLC